MPSLNTTNIISNFNIWAVVKIGYLIAILLYTVFALIVVRQVVLMTRALDGHLNKLLQIIAWIHLVLAVIVGLLALIIL